MQREGRLSGDKWEFLRAGAGRRSFRGGSAPASYCLRPDADKRDAKVSETFRTGGEFSPARVTRRQRPGRGEDIWGRNRKIKAEKFTAPGAQNKHQSFSAARSSDKVRAFIPCLRLGGREQRRPPRTAVGHGSCSLRSDRSLFLPW